MNGHHARTFLEPFENKFIVSERFMIFGLQPLLDFAPLGIFAKLKQTSPENDHALYIQ